MEIQEGRAMISSAVVGAPWSRLIPRDFDMSAFNLPKDPKIYSELCQRATQGGEEKNSTALNKNSGEFAKVHSVELLQVFRARFDKVRRVCSNRTFKLSLARFTEKNETAPAVSRVCTIPFGW